MSATIRSERAVTPGVPWEPAERDRAVQQFFGKLVGAEPSTIKVVGESAQELHPPADATYAAAPPPSAWPDRSNPEQLRLAVCRLAGVPDMTPLPEAGRRCRLLWDLRTWMGERARSISSLARLVSC
jgi:hypothetical protein